MTFVDGLLWAFVQWNRLHSAMTWYENVTQLAPAGQKMDSAIHRINHYPADTYKGTNYTIRWIEIRDFREL